MAKKCLECGKKKGFFAYNYAGFNVKGSAAHPFQYRIESLVLPGDKRKEFLCVECANKRKVTCKTHGAIHGRIEFGTVPTCQRCSQEQKAKQKEAEFRRTAMQWRDWGDRHYPLPCPFCGEKMDLDVFVTIGFGPGGSSGGGDIMAGMFAAAEQMKRPKVQKCPKCGKKFESRWEPGNRPPDQAAFYQWRPGSGKTQE